MGTKIIASVVAYDPYPPTKAPSGLTISRKKNDITFKWKITSKNYGAGQQLQWKTNENSWRSVTVGNSQTSKTVSINLSNFRPNTKNNPLNSISFRVRGRRARYTETIAGESETITPEWSAWTVKKLVLTIPPKPKASAKLSENFSNVSTFSWSTNVSNTGRSFFRDVKYQTCLIKDSGSNGKKYAKKFGNTVTGASASGSVTKTEDNTTLAQGSYTRWYRFRARGSRGSSKWQYVKHTYASPFEAVIKEAKKSDTDVGYRVYVKWTAKSDAAHRIHSTTVQYTIATPDPDLTCPPGASWTDVKVVKDTKKTDAVEFSVDQRVGYDECLFVRVNTTHDDNITYGDPVLVSGAVGPLSEPTSLSVTPNNLTHRAVVNATNNSAVSDSFLAVLFRASKKPDKIYVVGIIPNGSSTVTVQCPDWDDMGTISFGVRAHSGSYENRTVNYGCYEITSLMRSKRLWDGGAIPSEPENVTVATTSSPGVVQVGWDWTWTSANVAILSWSDEPTAWESTSEPSTYEIKSINDAQWNIAGLETGKTWYIRVKLAQDDGDGRTESSWSDMVSIDLSSAPSVPILEVSSPVMRVDGEVTASWAYSTTDGTYQAYAEISTAEINASGVFVGKYELSEDVTVDDDKNYFSESGGIYTLEEPVGTEDPSALGWYEVVPNVIAHTETAQHITLNAEELGWEAGNDYNICVRVTSASGRVSDSWSDPVGISVAEPLTAAIASSSLVSEVVEENPQDYTGARATFITANDVIPTIVSVVEDIPYSAGGYTETELYFSDDDLNTPEIYPVDWSGDAGTIYGGTYDWVSGKLISMYDSGGSELSPYDEYDLTPEEFTAYSGENNMWADIGDVTVHTADVVRDIYTLTAMPLTATITGAGDGGTTTLALERAETYHMDRPDDTDFNGYQGETVALESQIGEAQMAVDLSNLIGRLDDGAAYTLVATVNDDLGQSDEARRDFEVHWTHQAIMPTATANIDSDNYIAKITPVAPDGTDPTDVCDIYRLSVDAPQLVVENGVWGTTYVDPYPTIGQCGGHRVVFKTANGDYITEDQHPAWVDLGEDDGDILNLGYSVIDFDGQQLECDFNQSISNTFEKDFKETRYLGGAIQGDWNPGVHRSSSVNAVFVSFDSSSVKTLRALAAYTGICHVRTKDGSSYAADVQVGDEVSYDKAGKIVSASLTITRVDPEGYDGMSFADWAKGYNKSAPLVDIGEADYMELNE